MSRTEYQDIKIDRPRDRVLRITLNRPEKRNALSNNLRAELFDALHWADNVPDISVTIITGNEECFSAGYDLSEPKDGNDNLPYHTADGLGVWPRHVSEGCFQIWDLKKPVIAQVWGYALAGGMELCQACDLVFVADDAKIGYPPVRSLSPPDNQAMTWIMGFRNAMYLMLTGDSINGVEAVEQGFANKSFPADQLEEQVLNLAGRIARIPSDVQQICKRSVHRQMEIMGVRAGIRAGTEMQALAVFTDTTQKFFAKLKADGVKSAVSDRDEKFGDYSAAKDEA